MTSTAPHPSLELPFSPGARRRRQQLGQFFTPVAVAEFALEMLEAQGALNPPTPTPLQVIDPAAGEGVFLQAAIQRFSHRPLACAGVDLDPSLDFGWTQAVHDSRPDVRVTLVHGNGLLDHPEAGVRPEGFDLALGNPPYGGDGLADLARLAQGDDPRAPAFADAWRLARAVLDDSLVWRRIERRVRLPARPPSNLGSSLSRLLLKASRLPIEVIFVERFVSLLRPGGWMACVLPEGILANARTAYLREWLAEQGTVTAVVGLPRVFSRAGATARTALLIYHKHALSDPSPDPAASTLVTGPEMEWRPRDSTARSARSARRLEACSLDVTTYLDGVRDAVRIPRPESVASGNHHVPWARLCSQRWDPQFWDPRWAAPLRDLEGRPTRPLGDYIRSITYGPIVTGTFPDAFPGSVPVVSQGQFEESGINLHGCARVAKGCIFDPERSRARPRDLLMPRSGAGSLGRNRLAVYEGEETVNVGCFVNVIRLEGLNPWFAWFFLKTRFGWGQVRRVINGVGMPNISFDEIRALEIPVVADKVGQATENAWRTAVLPHHTTLLQAQHQGLAEPACQELRLRAHQACQCLVASLERLLVQGDDTNLLTAPPP